MASSPRSARLVEVLDVLDRRASLLRGVVLAVVLVGVLLALFAPGVLPPTPLVGATVAIVAIVLGVGVAIAVDAGDGVVRGPHHVRAIGGELVGALPTEVSTDAVGDLADAVLEARGEHRVVLGISAAGDDAATRRWADALAVALARRHASVLVVDVVGGSTPTDGLVEVVFEDATLGRSVTFEREVKLARLGAGRDLDRVLEAAAELPTRLPKDLEVLLLALPPVDAPGVLTVVEELDAVLLLAASGTTPRVQLQTGIEAVERAGASAQVVLIDDRAAAAGAPARDQAGPDRDAEVDGDAAGAARDGTEVDGDAAASAADPVAPTPNRAAQLVPADPEPELDVDPAGDPDVVPDGPDPASRDATVRLEAAVPTADAATTPLRSPVTPAPPASPVTPATPASSGSPAPTASPPAPGPDVPAVEAPDHRSITGRDVSADEPDRSRPRPTPREELGRSPSPSVRVVRGLPPSARSPRTGAPGEAPPIESAPTAASPRDPDLVSGAAAAGLAAQLADPTPGAPPSAPEEPEAPAGAEALPASTEPVPPIAVEPDPAALADPPAPADAPVSVDPPATSTDVPEPALDPATIDTPPTPADDAASEQAATSPPEAPVGDDPERTDELPAVRDADERVEGTSDGPDGPGTTDEDGPAAP